MGRPLGKRNPGFDKARMALLARLRERLLQPAGAAASFRQLAAAAGVSIATLRHYFVSRAGALAAVLEGYAAQGAPYYREIASAPADDLPASLRWLYDYITAGLAAGVTEIHALGLAAGVQEPTVGPAYLRSVLEPMLQAVEARLAEHARRGTLRPCDVRIAAIHFVAPLLVAALHQRTLGGAALRPLDSSGFAESHLAAFVRAYGAERAVDA